MALSKKSPVSNLAGQLQAQLQLLPPDARLCVGLSGGLDSVVLLDLLDQARTGRPFSLAALHVNHQLNPRADDWQAFCMALCAARGIPFQAVRVTVKATGAGLEAAAREARYAAFAAQPADYLALAHHLDDQAETFLLQLLRGGGVAGLSAMPVLRPAASGPAYWRPLLTATRSELDDYARAQGLAWVDDDSNLDRQFDRNYLRHEVLPLLADRFSAYRQVLGRTSRHMGEAAELMQDLAQIDAQDAIHAGRLDCRVLATLSFPRAKNLLRYFLRSHGAPVPAMTYLEELLRQVTAAAPDTHLQAPAGDGRCLGLYRGWLEFFTPTPVPGEDWDVIWQGAVRLDLPNGAWQVERQTGAGISLARLAGQPLILRNRRGGERLKTEARRPHHRLKQLLQEKELPPWRRHALVCIYCENQLIYVPGIGVACDWRSGPTGAGLVFLPR